MCDKLAGACLLINTAAGAAEAGPAPLDHGQVATVSRLLRDHYPLPDISARYGKVLARGLKAGRYDGQAPCPLANRLTEDLRAEHADLHLSVRCDAAPGDGSGLEEVAGPYHGIAAVTVDPDLPVTIHPLPGAMDRQ